MILQDVVFAHRFFFYLLLLIPMFIAWYLMKGKSKLAEVKLSSTAALGSVPRSAKLYLTHVPFILRLLAVTAIIIALARPQSSKSYQNIRTEGIDIVLAMDISASMLAQDLQPNRLEASKNVAINFIDSRPNDRIGLVIFSGESFTQCPLTTDHSVLKNLFASIKSGMVQDGTAIGMGLTTAVSRLENSNAKSKVVILLTDGVNNAGSVAPLTAAEVAKAFGVRVYTIGVGTKGKAYSPVGIYPDGRYVFDYVDVKIDEETMSEIAGMTNGKYYRATNNEKLKQVYAEIDKLEKTIIEEKQFTKKQELYLPFALFAAAALLLEFLLKNTYLKRIP